jgi:hypothetical protein
MLTHTLALGPDPLRKASLEIAVLTSSGIESRAE